MVDAVRTQVAIIGAGPAGLMLAHLLHASGIASIVVDNRGRADIEATIRAGILENGTVDLLVASGASDRVLSEGHRHDGIELRFEGEGHRIDFRELAGRSVWLYPQHEVLKDLLARLLADGADIRFEHAAEQVVDEESDTPRVVGRDAAGEPFEIVADFVVGADGSRSIVRTAVVGSQTGGYFREYPFAWFGILTEAPPSAKELIYANSASGFALISQRIRHRAADVPAVRSGAGPRVDERCRDLGRAAVARLGDRAETRARSSSATCSGSAASWPGSCRSAGWCSSGMPPTPCRRPARRA